MSLKTVNPGELITALEWNKLVATINGLDLRVTTLESGGVGQAPHITQILPPGPVTAGDIIRIFGSHFDFLKGGHSVYFGSTRATFFQNDSSDTLLIVKVPDPTDGAVEAGTTMTLTVGNLVTTTTQAIIVKAKPEVTAGDIQFSFQKTRPTATPTSNQQFFYDFELRSQANKDLTVTITPEIAVVKLPVGKSDPGLPNLLMLIDNNQERPNHQISLAAGATKTVSFRLNIPAGMDTLQYSFRATASAPGVVDQIETLAQQEVGAASEQPDPMVSSFEFFMSDDANSTFDPNTGGLPGIDGTLKVTKGKKAIIELEAIFVNIPQGGKSYHIDAEVTPGNVGWVGVVNSTMTNPLPVPTPGAVQVMFDVTAPNSADTATLKVTLTRETTNKRSVSYRLITK